VFDEFDNLFSADQIKHMKLRVEASPKGLELLELRDGYLLTNELQVRGLISEDYFIKIVDENSKIMSNTVKLVVFDKLDIFPGNLLLTPGMSYMLNVRGGPREFISVRKRYEIADKGVATVKSNEPEVRAVDVGETTLKV